MGKLIELFNGKKTAIGFVLLLAAQAVAALVPEQVGLVKALEWIGGLLGGAGVIHKAVKGELQQ